MFTTDQLKNKSRLLKRLLIFLITLCVIAPYIATEKPWYVNYNQQHLFPAFSFNKQITIDNVVLSYEETDWKRLDADQIIFAPIPWSAGKSDFENSDYISPFGNQLFLNNSDELVKLPLRFRHWMGTDKRGADILSGLLNGARVSLFVAILSMLIATIIGVLLGAIAGYAGDRLIKLKMGSMIVFIPGLVLAVFYAGKLSISSYGLLLQLMQYISIIAVVLSAFYFIGLMVSRISFFSKKIYLPIDSIVSRLIEWNVALPRLILILTLASISGTSLINLALIIGFTGWTDIARLTRAEFLRIRELDFVQAAKVLGFSHQRIIVRHILPNAISPILTSVLFGVSSAILAEAGLSFLGIGVPQNIVTWGNMLASGKENFMAWWLVVFPGSALFFTVLLFNSIGEKIRNQ